MTSERGNGIVIHCVELGFDLVVWVSPPEIVNDSVRFKCNLLLPKFNWVAMLVDNVEVAGST